METREETYSVRQWIINSYKESGLLLNNPNDYRLIDKLSTDMLSVLDGCLAGDGHLTPLHGYKETSTLILGLSLKQLEHAKEFADRLIDFNFYPSVKEYPLLNNGLGSVRVLLTSIAFAEQRKRWYPNGIKIVPKDITNTPEMWRWFYAGDGCQYQCSTYGIAIRLCVQGFVLEDILFLSKLLKEHNINSWPMKDRISKITNKWTYFLTIKTKDSEKFLKLTSPPVAGLEYKWRLPERETKICPECKNIFLPKRSDMIFCSRKCGVIANHPFYKDDIEGYIEYRRKVKIQEQKRRALKPGYKTRKKKIK